MHSGPFRTHAGHRKNNTVHHRNRRHRGKTQAECPRRTPPGGQPSSRCTFPGVSPVPAWPGQPRPGLGGELAAGSEELALDAVLPLFPQRGRGGGWKEGSAASLLRWETATQFFRGVYQSS